MTLQQILGKIDNFNPTEEMEDYELTVFFDEKGEELPELEDLKEEEKKSIIQALFNFLKRQPADFNEDWSFIHLIEAIDNPTYEIYDKELLKNNKDNCSLTSLILLNRYINALTGEEKEKRIQLMKEIGENEELSERIREEANENYKWQRGIS